ncbi:hypothetical protein [Halolamina salifodinae]|uniref:Uncharacterized protein n=1 Tax=Halolamina salifodinae TaxID=1202767 RepID=A0A8T4H0P6_9EURY|nr:hypothetical protein [Halolamina salifodinae]MBP1987155.1 hypothetical protein [Halolamina salifodinae]
MSLAETVLLAGVALALFGVVSVLGDAIFADADRRFVAYLVGLMLAMATVGYLLLEHA